MFSVHKGLFRDSNRRDSVLLLGQNAAYQKGMARCVTCV